MQQVTASELAIFLRVHLFDAKKRENAKNRKTITYPRRRPRPSVFFHSAKGQRVSTSSHLLFLSCPLQTFRVFSSHGHTRTSSRGGETGVTSPFTASLFSSLLSECAVVDLPGSCLLINSYSSSSLGSLTTVLKEVLAPDVSPPSRGCLGTTMGCLARQTC